MFLYKAKNDSDVVMMIYIYSNLDDTTQQSNHTANTSKNQKAS